MFNIDINLEVARNPGTCERLSEYICAAAHAFVIFDSGLCPSLLTFISQFSDA